ncbi:hypothetical protein V9T40_005914 [Parthenolecanium corni]|uniref:Uncharacterized protein n=1 Tax=Parthenolecanium corni TaxID=536013 RepID=A0AAN9Y938_9HEMI
MVGIRFWRSSIRVSEAVTASSLTDRKPGSVDCLMHTAVSCLAAEVVVLPVNVQIWNVENSTSWVYEFRVRRSLRARQCVEKSEIW